MTGKELIQFIQNHHLEDYEIKIYDEESCHEIDDVYVGNTDSNEKIFYLF